MILFCFPLPIENPFSVKLSKTDAVIFNNKALLLVGKGTISEETLDTYLQKSEGISHIIEVGGAGINIKEKQGVIYEPTTLINPGTGEFISLKKTTNAPEATLHTVTTIFRIDPHEQQTETLLFTQETWHLHRVAKKHNIPFTSLRVATDSGEDDIRKRFVKTIQSSRKEMIRLIDLLVASH